MKIYKARKGAQFSNKKAQIYGRCLEKIEKKKGGISPQDAVDEGESRNSPLHPYFEWDNRVAGKKFRLHQARLLLNSIVVEVTIHGKTRQTRAYLNVDVIPVDNGEESVSLYINTKKALTEPEYRRQVLQDALNRIDLWKQNYNLYSELAPIFKAIEKVKKKIRRWR